MSTHSILSIDGGGTRGIVPATILHLLEEDLKASGKIQQSILEKFDLLAGTSTGGILSTGLCFGQTTKEMIDLYLEFADDIFYDTIWDDIKDLPLNIRGADYNQVRFKKILKNIFKNSDLSDIHTKLAGKSLMVCAFELEPFNKVDGQLTPANYRPRVFHSDFMRDQEESLVDLCLKTSAGPTYFPIYDGFVDGGIALNNPSMAAIAYSINQKEGESEYRLPDGKKKGLEKNLSDIKLLSLGTGTAMMNRITEKEIGNGDWGLLKWAGHISNLLTETNMASSEYYVSNVLGGDQYRRVQTNFQDFPDSLIYKDLIAKGKSVDLDIKEKDLLEDMIETATKVYEQQKDDLIAFMDE